MKKSAPFEAPQLSIEDLLGGDLSLASPPEIYRRLRRLGQDPNTSAGMLAKVIEHDPAVAARVLGLANSAFFSMPRQVDGIEEAVRLIGLRELEDLVLATEVIQKFDGIPADLIDIYAFWRDSVRCAVSARSLALRSRLAKSPGPVFIAGLLHGIGHLIIYTRIPEFGRKALLEHRHRGRPLAQVQREVIGFDYTAVGAALAARWELPEAYQVVLDNQLHPERAPVFEVETALVHLAVRMAAAGSFSRPDIDPQLPSESAAWTQAGLTTEALDQALDEAANDYQAALALLQ